MKINRISIGALFIFVLLFYAKTLPYSYVFDDVWRISKNPAVQSLAPISNYFTDPSTLSGFPPLNKHNYRPLLALSFALENKLWGAGPTLHRLVNLIFHGLNASLVAFCGTLFLGLSPGAALFGGAIFAFHPIQVESAIWISERSGVMGLTCFLLGLIAWWKFLETQENRWIATTFAVFITGLLFRENLIIFPMACLMLHRLKSGDQARIDSSLIRVYGGMGFVSCAYLFLRTLVLKQFAQAGLWGGRVTSHLFAILENAGRTVLVMVAPIQLSPYHELPVPASITGVGVLGLTALLVAILCLLRSKNQRLMFCVSLLLILWLPSSNLIPVAIIFADRFAAPLLIPAAWLIGLAIDRFRRSNAIAMAFIVVFGLLIRTWFYLPVWQKESSLWQHVLNEYPHSNFGWFCLGIEREKQLDWRSADQAYNHALEGTMRADFAAQAFLHLARVKLAEGQAHEAEDLAQQAIQMNPDLRLTWEEILKNPKSTDGTMEFFFR